MRLNNFSALLLLPFVVLLALLALAPLFFPDWWGRFYPRVVAGLALIVAAWYWLVLQNPGALLHTAGEYFSFIALIGSLYVVSGGIHINVKGEATPLANVAFLLVGAIIANLLGTTGASMLLIRPWLRMNKYRVTGYHVTFFIFIVSNVGGCLTPVGDPPLFLGYLMGIPFWWVAVHCLPVWAVGVSALIGMFFVVDYRNHRRASARVRERLTGHGEVWRFTGLGNLVFLAVILGSVFVNRPRFLREFLMIAAALGSYYTTKKEVHAANHFSLHPIKEVAILFIGIFATMMPALDWLEIHAGRLSATGPGFFYFGSGVLSSVLDNAPTYLCFLKAAAGRLIPPEALPQLANLVHTHGAGLATLTGPHANQIREAFMALQQFHPAELARGVVSDDLLQTAYLLGNIECHAFLVAISVGAVFFGANTYIGNGPNFMVKAIADQQKVHTPTFLTYVWKHTLPVMVPMLLLVWLLFFRK